MSGGETLLDRLETRGVIDAARRGALAAEGHTPWWLAALLAGAAWIASLLILSTFYLPLLMVGDSALVRGLGGLALLAAALYLFRRTSPFTAQMALAFSLAGQAVLASAVAELGSNGAAVTGALVAAALLQAPASPAHRAVCALIVAGNLAWLIGPGPRLALFGVALAGLGAALWLGRDRWAVHPRAAQVKAVAHGATLAALCLAPYGHARFLTDVVGTTRDAAVPLLYAAGAAAVLVGTAAWLTRRAGSALRLGAPAAAALFALAAHPAPGLLVAAALCLASFHACHRAWTMLTLAFAALYLGELYYSLHTTLLMKSLALAASGALLLGLRAVLKRWADETAWAPR